MSWVKEWGKEKLLDRQSYCKKMSFKLVKGSQAHNNDIYNLLEQTDDHFAILFILL